MKPLIISFEGIDGSGKTTSIKLVSALLEAKGIPHIVTQELSGDEQRMKYRNMLMELNNGEYSRQTSLDELLIISLARRWHFRHVIAPALAEGKHVIMDRFIDSTWAYQGQLVDHQTLEFFQSQVWEVPAPDLTILLTGPCMREDQRDKFEKMGADFFSKAQEIYNLRAEGRRERSRTKDEEQPNEVRKISEARREQQPRRRRETSRRYDEDENTRSGRKFLLANPQLDSGQAEIERMITASIEDNQ